MIIKSHIRGGYRAAADYLKAQGENEKIRTVEISDPDAKTLDQAFQNMWAVANNSKVKKPLHHISINPMKGETLTDEQVLKIVERCEQKYGYKPGDHQRVIVEHVKDGRQHFHVMWNRVSLTTGKVVKSGEHWKKSKQAAREMEQELGLKRPVSRRQQRQHMPSVKAGRSYSGHKPTRPFRLVRPNALIRAGHAPLPSSGFMPSQPVSGMRLPKLPQTPSARPDPQLSPAPRHLPVIRPVGMSEEQWLDFLAACEGKITWAAYFRKWERAYELTIQE